MKTQSVEPYRVLFPIGILHALSGTIVWILFSLQRIDYPGIFHADQMVGGFLFSFVSGFLLTAIPRFTGTQSCSKTELAIASFLTISSLFISNHIIILALLIFLILFFLKRISKRTFTPPPYFIFLPFGLMIGLFGATTITLIDTKIINAKYLSMGRLFLYHGTMLFIVLGIGSKLIPALLGWGPPPTPESLAEIPHDSSKLKKTFPVIMAFLLLVGFILEASEFFSEGRILRVLCASWIGISFWKLHHLPRKRQKWHFGFGSRHGH